MLLSLTAKVIRCCRRSRPAGCGCILSARSSQGSISCWCIFFAAVEKAAPAQIISLCRGIFFIIPAAFLLSSALGITGVWLAFPAAELLALLLGLLLYRRNRKVLSLPVSESEI